MKKRSGASGAAREKKKNKGETLPLAELLSRRFDIPADLLCGGLTVELRGRNDLYVSGCERILSYSTERIALLVHGAELTVTGKRMVCTTYYNAQLGIDGEIDGLAFSDFVSEGKKH